ncbi:MAG TPA: transporter associated domain-containing protein, partial [Planctomycetota bacterium]|nr:transporter associated domain-containing protein [Planctomycetota bacterium]
SLARALERSAEHGVLLESEAEILSGVVELAEVRVREIMTPRVDLLLLDVNEPDRERIVREAVERKLPWLVVVDESADRVLGRVRVRDLLIHPGRSTLEMLVVVRFVPEVASALHLLHFLREEKVAQALVVDEWGGTAGVVTIEDIFEEIVGELRVEGEPTERPVLPLGGGAFRVVGSLSIRDWNEQFGHRVVPTEFETLGGFVTALLGRIPRPGDEVRSGPLVFRVHDVRRRRIQTVDVSVAEPAGVPA